MNEAHHNGDWQPQEFPSANKRMQHKEYSMRPGGKLRTYHEHCHAKWYDYDNDIREDRQAPLIPDGWPDVITSFRFSDMLSIPRPKLSDDEKRSIVATAKTREDFHDLDKIMGAPRYGTCLCELRIITGQDCLQHLEKGEDGKTVEAGKDHWAWFLDVCPRGLLCPFAKSNGIAAENDPNGFSCKILIEAPTSDWVLEQAVEDEVGTHAGRATSDIVATGKCARCRGRAINPKTNELRDTTNLNPLLRPTGGVEPRLYSEPPDYGPDDEPENQPPDWEPWLCIYPMMFQPELDDQNKPLRYYHPFFKAGKYYHERTFDGFREVLDRYDLWNEDKHMSWGEFDAQQRDREAEIKAGREAEEAKFKAAHEKDLADSEEREKILNAILPHDTRQWH